VLLAQAANTPLAIMDHNQPFSLFVDASNYAAATVLTENVRGKLDKPVTFASVKLTTTQRNWATVEKEAFACILALKKKKYHRWLFSKKLML